MRGVLEGLKLPIPQFVRQDVVLLVFRQLASKTRKPTNAPLSTATGAAASSSTSNASSLSFAVQACTSHGWKCPVPAIASVKITFPVSSCRLATGSALRV
jgi:hypothetical protein